MNTDGDYKIPANEKLHSEVEHYGMVSADIEGRLK